MNRRHDMPFGAQVTANGAVRFQLWAPAAQRVAVQLESPSGVIDVLPMADEGDGWHRLESDRAAPGMYYRYCIDDSVTVPDPASRFQPHDVHGPSEIIDPAAWRWQDHDWPGRPWEEAVFYELHVGTFTREGTFTGIITRLDELVELGITAVELMPVADFPGRRDWGYNGALPFAPDSCYGRPDDLKTLVQAAHDRGLMMFLDVVYNHFGPEGNYLGQYAPQFFSESHHSPWGAAINFDGPDSHWVRQYFIHNALYWLEEFHFDGLRLDAVHEIYDDSSPDILQALAEAVHAGPGRTRPVHLVLENDDNATHYLRREDTGKPGAYAAQWNDDYHHILHIIASGEQDGYYQDYIPRPIEHLARCLSEGFAYQGEISRYREHTPRGESTAGLPPSAFVNFIQNHDQIGNRPLGDRLTRISSDAMVTALSTILLLAPPPPLLFMGQEWGSTQPFPFFCDFEESLMAPVREGRRRELALMHGGDPDTLVTFDPFADATFSQSVLHWDERNQSAHAQWLALHRRLLALRHEQIVPRMANMVGREADHRILGDLALTAWWILGDRSRLTLHANLGTEAVAGIRLPEEPLLFATCGKLLDTLPPLSAVWTLGGAG